MNASAPLSIQTPRIFLPLLPRRRFRGIKGGRGSGKSHFVGEDLVEQALRQHTRCVCAREVQNSIKDSSKQLIEDKITLMAHRYAGAVFDAQDPAKILVPGDSRRFKQFMSAWRITEREISFPQTDSLFIFRGLQNHTAASIKSLEGFTDLWAEEAQTLSQRSLDLAIPTFRKGSQLTFTWNPLLPKDPVEKLFKDAGAKAQTKDAPHRAEGQDEDFVLVEANYFDNPWFPDELRRDMERDKRRDPDKYGHVWLGGYQKASEARVFKNYRVQEFETPEDARFHFGGDWGFSVDPTVAVRCFIGWWRGGKAIADVKGDVLFIDYEAYKVGCEIDNTPALFAGTDTKKVKRWENPYGYPGIPGATEWPFCADSARPETISYMNRHGFTRIKGAKKGAGSVEDGIEFLKSYDIVIHPRCEHVVDEFATYSYKIDPKTQEVLPVLEDKKNHTIDACRYALESTRRSNYTLDNVG